jgi:hypothetical protein
MVYRRLVCAIKLLSTPRIPKEPKNPPTKQRWVPVDWMKVAVRLGLDRPQTQRPKRGRTR